MAANTITADRPNGERGCEFGRTCSRATSIQVAMMQQTLDRHEQDIINFSNELRGATMRSNQILASSLVGAVGIIITLIVNLIR